MEEPTHLVFSMDRSDLHFATGAQHVDDFELTAIATGGTRMTRSTSIQATAAPWFKRVSSGSASRRLTDLYSETGQAGCRAGEPPPKQTRQIHSGDGLRTVDSASSSFFVAPWLPTGLPRHRGVVKVRRRTKSTLSALPLRP